MSFCIRPIETRDNAQVAELVRTVLQEFGCVGPGFAWADPELDYMCAHYSQPGRGFWVIADAETGRIFGGGGIARLKNYPETEQVSELQKVYLYPQIRGQGWGRRLIETCMDAARAMGYRHMYLDSTPQMQDAVRLYRKLGFQHLQQPLGDNGHNSCSIFMLRSLEADVPSVTTPVS